MFHGLEKFRIFIAGLIVFSFAVAVVPLQARDRDDRKCEQRIHKAQEALERAERKHGSHSRQAEQRRHELEEARERCHHRDRDHDRDHDHDHR